MADFQYVETVMYRQHGLNTRAVLAARRGVAKLALGCATSDELDSCLSALGAILAHLNFPDARAPLSWLICAPTCTSI